MDAFETIIYRKKDGVGHITLNRPQALNAVNIKMRDELYEVLPAVTDDPDVKVAIITGAGERAFSAGADISEFGTTPSRVIARQIRWERDLWGQFLAVPKPIIVAINGYALGAGIEMAMCCDIRIASTGARFGLPEVGLGMIPTAGGSQTLPRTVRQGWSQALVLTGDIIDAAEAFRIGLVHKVVAREELMPAAEAVAAKLMSRSQSALKYAKQAINRGLDLTLEQGLELEGRLFARVLKTEDAAKGIGAYQKDGSPSFAEQGV